MNMTITYNKLKAMQALGISNEMLNGRDRDGDCYILTTKIKDMIDAEKTTITKVAERLRIDRSSLSNKICSRERFKRDILIKICIYCRASELQTNELLCLAGFNPLSNRVYQDQVFLCAINGGKNLSGSQKIEAVECLLSKY